MEKIQLLIAANTAIIAIAMSTYFYILGKDVDGLHNKINNLEKKINKLLNKK